MGTPAGTRYAPGVSGPRAASTPFAKRLRTAGFLAVACLGGWLPWATLAVAQAPDAAPMQPHFGSVPTPPPGVTPAPQPENPPEDPPEVRHCMRPSNRGSRPSLNPAEPLRARLDLESGQVVLDLPPTPPGATCYQIQRAPRGSGDRADGVGCGRD